MHDDMNVVALILFCLLALISAVFVCEFSCTDLLNVWHVVGGNFESACA